MKSLGIVKDNKILDYHWKTHMSRMVHMCFSNVEFSKRILKYYLEPTVYDEFFANLIFLNIGREKMIVTPQAEIWTKSYTRIRNTVLRDRIVRQDTVKGQFGLKIIEKSAVETLSKQYIETGILLYNSDRGVIDRDAIDRDVIDRGAIDEVPQIDVMRLRVSMPVSKTLLWNVSRFLLKRNNRYEFGCSKSIKKLDNRSFTLTGNRFWENVTIRNSQIEKKNFQELCRVLNSFPIGIKRVRHTLKMHHFKMVPLLLHTEGEIERLIVKKITNKITALAFHTSNKTMWKTQFGSYTNGVSVKTIALRLNASDRFNAEKRKFINVHNVPMQLHADAVKIGVSKSRLRLCIADKCRLEDRLFVRALNVRGLNSHTIIKVWKVCSRNNEAFISVQDKHGLESSLRITAFHVGGIEKHLLVNMLSIPSGPSRMLDAAFQVRVLKMDLPLNASVMSYVESKMLVGVLADRILESRLREAVLTKRMTESRVNKAVLTKRMTESRVNKAVLVKHVTESRVNKAVLVKHVTESVVHEAVLAKRIMESAMHEAVSSKRVIESRVNKAVLAKRMTESRVHESVLAKCIMKSVVHEVVSSKRIPESRKHFTVFNVHSMEIQSIYTILHRRDPEKQRLDKRFHMRGKNRLPVNMQNIKTIQNRLFDSVVDICVLKSDIRLDALIKKRVQNEVLTGVSEKHSMESFLHDMALRKHIMKSHLHDAVLRKRIEKSVLYDVALHKRIMESRVHFTIFNMKSLETQLIHMVLENRNFVNQWSSRIANKSNNESRIVYTAAKERNFVNQRSSEIVNKSIDENRIPYTMPDKRNLKNQKRTKSLNRFIREKESLIYIWNVNQVQRQHIIFSYVKSHLYNDTQNMRKVQGQLLTIAQENKTLKASFVRSIIQTALKKHVTSENALPYLTALSETSILKALETRFGIHNQCISPAISQLMQTKKRSKLVTAEKYGQTWLKLFSSEAIDTRILKSQYFRHKTNSLIGNDSQYTYLNAQETKRRFTETNGIITLYVKKLSNRTEQTQSPRLHQSDNPEKMLHLSNVRRLHKHTEDKLISKMREIIKDSEKLLKNGIEEEMHLYMRQEIQTLEEKIRIQEKLIEEIKMVKSQLLKQTEQKNNMEKMRKLEEFFNNDLALDRKRYGIQ